MNESDEAAGVCGSSARPSRDGRDVGRTEDDLARVISDSRTTARVARNMRMWIAPILLLLIAGTCSAQWIPQESRTEARLRGLGVVNQEVAWASGTGGTCLRTTDGGKTWVVKAVPGASSFDFRDVHAVDAEIAYLLSIGEGERSRIYKTTDGGTTWALQHTNRIPEGFLDAVAFWDAENGLAMGDPVEGRFTI